MSFILSCLCETVRSYSRSKHGLFIRKANVTQSALNKAVSLQTYGLRESFGVANGQDETYLIYHIISWHISVLQI